MLYDIGLFCIILAVVIGLTSIAFQLPVKRTLSLIAVLMVASAILIGIGSSMAVMPMAQEQVSAHE